MPHDQFPNFPEEFKRAASAQWTMLNPRYPTESGDSYSGLLMNAARETIPGFFAPAKMALWVLGFAATATWRRITT